jgi:type I restriction enzyme M protein
LFEGGAGETVRRRLLKDFDLHTTLRLPTDKLWVYDLRTNQHFTLQQNPLRPHHLDEFVECYTLGKPRSERGESERFKAFTYDELVVREKANLDITWLRDESLDDMDNLPAPEIIAREIVEDLTAALAEFEAVAVALELAAADGGSEPSASGD